MSILTSGPNIALNHRKNQIDVPIGPPPNLPRADLLEGSREQYLKIGVPLYEASIRGNWKAAKVILDERQELIRFAITENYETPLHIAASAESTKSVEEFVENLVNLMETNDLELQNKSYNTALSLAAAAGNIKTTMIMVKKNPALLEIPGRDGMMPLYVAALFSKPQMVRYLYDNSKKMSGDLWTDENRGWVLRKCVEADIFDVALKIMNDRPELADKKRLVTDVLLVLAQKTWAFEGCKPHIILRIIYHIFHVKVAHAEKESDAMQLLRTIWQKIAIMPKSMIDDIIRGPALEQGDKVKKYPFGLLFVAAKMGNMRFITELIQSYPDLIWKTNDKGQTIFHIAVKHRHTKIYSLLYEVGAMKDLITSINDRKGNNMLHFAARSAKPKQLQNVSGIVLEMQRELLWFKEVEQMIPPDCKRRKNEDGETPHDLFTKKHKKLVTEGEEWVKNTASQCMVVATLIATTVFAASFTIPNPSIGLPFSQQNAAFAVFAISNTVSLFCSTMSILFFLSILTARQSELDFSQALPKKLMFGLATLFLSTITMMVSFITTFLSLYSTNLKWVLFIFALLTFIPIIVFFVPEVRLLWEIFYYTFHSSYIFKPKKRMLYYN